MDLSKIEIYDIWHDYIKEKYDNKATLWYIDTDSFIMCIKTEDFHNDIAKDVKQRFDASNYKVERPLLKGKNENVYSTMKHEMGGVIIKEFVRLHAKICSYLKDDDKEEKKSKGRKTQEFRHRSKFDNYKNCLTALQIVFIISLDWYSKFFLMVDIKYKRFKKFIDIQYERLRKFNDI